MKKILIATDLSLAGSNAARYGVQLAGAMGAGVILFSVYEQVPVTGAPLIKRAEDMEAWVVDQLQREKAAVVAPEGVVVDVLAREGAAATAIVQAAREAQAELIIAGMKGSGKTLRKVFGSTVTALARKTDIPLLVIPEGMRFSAPKAIGLASDVLQARDLSIPLVVRQFADVFHSRMFVIRLFSRQSGEVIEILHQSEGSNRTIGAFSPLCELPADESMADALNDYIHVSPIDLLVMTPHPKAAPERWFLRSNTRQMIFRTTIPLLILPNQKT